MLVVSLENIKDFSLLQQEVLNLVDSLAEKNLQQISCQQLEPDGDDWTAGVGKIAELDHKDEPSYKFINPKLKGSILEEYIKRYNGFRTRIMIMPPKQCYSVHFDPTPRIHIPIITNEQSWMVWPYENKCYQMKKGQVYWTDTRKYHSFFNGSDSNRIHIVMGIIE